jgi:hypothetical protein
MTEWNRDDAFAVQREEGRMEGVQAIVRNMKASNVPVSQTNAYTGLSEQQIQDL